MFLDNIARTNGAASKINAAINATNLSNPLLHVIFRIENRGQVRLIHMIYGVLKSNMFLYPEIPMRGLAIQDGI